MESASTLSHHSRVRTLLDGIPGHERLSETELAIVGSLVEIITSRLYMHERSTAAQEAVSEHAETFLLAIKELIVMRKVMIEASDALEVIVKLSAGTFSEPLSTIHDEAMAINEIARWMRKS